MCAKSLQSCPTSCDPMDCSPPGSLSMGFSRQEYWSGLLRPSPGDLLNPGIEPKFPKLQADSFFHLLSEPPGKPKNTGVGSLSPLQGTSKPGIEPKSHTLQAASFHFMAQ